MSSFRWAPRNTRSSWEASRGRGEEEGRWWEGGRSQLAGPLSQPEQLHIICWICLLLCKTSLKERLTVASL